MPITKATVGGSAGHDYHSDSGVGFPAPPLDLKPTYAELVEALREIERLSQNEITKPVYLLESVGATAHDILKRLDA